MKVLLTGAFGNVGMSTLQDLLRRGHVVRTFDRLTRTNRRAAARCGAHETFWGDIRSAANVATAVADQDVVIHLVAIFPPHSELAPARAEAVNVGGTKNILAAIAASARPPKLIYASSVALYGHAQDRPPPRTADEPIEITDHYTRQKAESVRLVRASGGEWAILRLCAIVPVVLGGKDPRLMFREMFMVPPDQRVECIHTRDAGAALATAAGSDEVWGKTLLIGGGASCQIDGRAFIGEMLEALGIGAFPDSAYSVEQFHTDWVDSAESQRLLQYQRHTFEDYLAEMRRGPAYQRAAIRLFRPAVRRFLLRQSPFYGKRSIPGGASAVAEE